MMHPGPGAARQISAYSKNAPKIIPQLVMAVEHYNRIARMMEAGENVKMTVDLDVEWQDADPMGYNTIAEIPGSDLKDEIVMLGGHMDSWHAGTGATDNAAGVAVAMEAVRILQALNLKPRRTIRIALWSGEEQGLLGSRAYVAEHFGKMETAAPRQAWPRRRLVRPPPPLWSRSRSTKSSVVISTWTTALERFAVFTFRATKRYVHCFVNG